MKSNIFNQTLGILKSQKLNVVDKDIERPWGGFFVIAEEDSHLFSNIYFDGIDVNKLKVLQKLSPKILFIKPNKRLSWSYHNRRSEIWKVVSGEVKVITSHDNIERKEVFLKENDVIDIYNGERHRIVGTSDYAVVAEIWIHADNDNPSDENDIVRVQDDYGR